jgi:hypothetical protein
VIFKLTRKEILTSTAVRQLLAVIGDFEEPLKIAAGGNLTREAADILTKAGFRVLSRTEPSDKQTSTPFAERVLFSRAENPTGWNVKDWETANRLLGYLDPEKNPYAIFSLSDGSYVQCLGAKKALTVEARVYDSNGQFTHWVFGKGNPSGRQTTVGSHLDRVTIDESQLLQMRDARLIIRQFLETRTFPQRYHPQEVTERFTRPGNTADKNQPACSKSSRHPRQPVPAAGRCARRMNYRGRRSV